MGRGYAREEAPCFIHHSVSGERTSAHCDICLFVNRTGQNPTGGTLSVERRREIYRLACVHDIVILEDGWYLAFQNKLDSPLA